MIDEINKMIEKCLDNSESLSSAEINFIRELDETMKMPSDREIEILKRIYNSVRLEKVA